MSCAWTIPAPMPPFPTTPTLKPKLTTPLSIAPTVAAAARLGIGTTRPAPPATSPHPAHGTATGRT